MIDAETLTGIVKIVAEADNRDVPALVTIVREAFPDILVSMCYEDEICGSEPLVETPGINLYLLATSESGCQSLTQDPTIANGVVLAEVDDDA